MFERFGRIKRLAKERYMITEKLDGTNAQIFLFPMELCELYKLSDVACKAIKTRSGLMLMAGSRNKIISPQEDNYGFAKWAWDNAEELAKLGEGRHFGEWWGQGIQRRYGLNEKRFSLFNHYRWNDSYMAALEGQTPEWPDCNLHVVPSLGTCAPSVKAVDVVMNQLHTSGSIAAPGFMNPEGIIIYACLIGKFYKKTFKHDKGKWTSGK